MPKLTFLPVYLLGHKWNQNQYAIESKVIISIRYMHMEYYRKPLWHWSSGGRLSFWRTDF